MNKYDPLGAYLRTQSLPLVPMTFKDIERLLRMPLPPSKAQTSWWLSRDSSMARQWLDSGYETATVDVGAEILVLRRIETIGPDQSKGENTRPAMARLSTYDPIFGAMKGTLILLANVDLAEPADPDWGKDDQDG